MGQTPYTRKNLRVHLSFFLFVTHHCNTYNKYQSQQKRGLISSGNSFIIKLTNDPCATQYPAGIARKNKEE